VAFDAVDAAGARGCDTVVVDTAGRLHTQGDLMTELAKVGGSWAGRWRARPMRRSWSWTPPWARTRSGRPSSSTQALELSGLVLAKLDSTAKGGVVVALKQELDLPVKLVGTGRASGPGGLRPRRFSRAVLEG
jgi:fused signal recognition particle receptor